jgi:hypothetical protein
MTDIEQPMICIRLYRKGGRYMESANNNKKGKIRKKGRKEYKKSGRKRRKKEKTHVQ